MAEEFDKSEEATPFKLREARKKGQVAKSMELPAFFSMAAITIAGSFAIMGIGGVFHTFTSWWLENAWYSGEQLSLLGPRVANYLIVLSKALMPLMAVGLLASVVASLIHIGPVFSLHPLKPDLQKLNPAKGLKKVFSRRALVEIFKLIVKITSFVFVATLVWNVISPKILNIYHTSLSSVLLNWKNGFFTLAFSFLVIFFLSSLFDLWYSKRDFARQMRMSKRDIKDEYKRHEGNPEVKNKRKKIVNELRERITSTSRLRDADVIITNPTHVAVALKYRSKSMALPIVLVAGRGLFAKFLKIRGRKMGVPIIRNPALARALSKTTGHGHPIDLSLQNEVAEVYRWVLSIPGNKVHS